MFFIYILKCADNTLYIGKTNNLEKRLRQHNGILTGGAKYTSGRRPVELMYKEEVPTITEALKREYALKQLTRSEKLALLK